MTDITKIPLEELHADRLASANDVLLCQKALALGVDTYNGESTQKRLDVNAAIVAMVDAELERRTQNDRVVD